MPFPVSAVGELELISQPHISSTEAALRSIDQWLRSQRARHISQGEIVITFRGGIFRAVSGWNILGSISSGQIGVTAHGHRVKLSYHLRFTQVLILSTAMVVLFLGPAVVAVPNFDMSAKLLFLAGAWGWVFGGN